VLFGGVAIPESVLLLPVLSMYPALHALGAEARERLVAQEFAPQAVNLREDLQERLRGALETIDALPSLEAFITEPVDDAAPGTDQAFSLWSRTELATYRLTSAVELYAADGQLTSRFALNLPEYSAENAIVRPSGENLGNSSIPAWVVSRRATPPSVEPIQMSPA